MIKDIKFSVILCVYKKDNASDFCAALESIVDQTLVPTEINIVCDGPLTDELDEVIFKYQNQYEFINVYRLKENQGHGNARRYAIDKCKYNLVALMDADDISVHDRFEKQIDIFKKHPDVSVVGGQIYEFMGETTNIVGKRELPKYDDDIKEYMKRRCPMNQVTVIFKKNDVIDSGNYIDWYCEEDYYLWIRMAEKGYKFYNIQENLVFVRVSNGMYGRRGGMKYFNSEKRLQKYMLQQGIINIFIYLYNVSIRFVAEVLIPDKLRSFLYKKMLRNN